MDMQFPSEWAYQNPHHYNYPLPLDRAWYEPEKIKYWVFRQAEILGGLSDTLSE